MKLEKMTDTKLNTLFKEVTAEVDRRKQANSVNAKVEKELAALAKKYGVDTVKRLAATTKKRAVKKRAKVKPVYQNPDNSAQTWTGRGRTPQWVAEAEKKTWWQRCSAYPCVVKPVFTGLPLLLSQMKERQVVETTMSRINNSNSNSNYSSRYWFL
jgi:DNA-binding protein H-NS